MQTALVCAALDLLIVYAIRCAFIYRRRTWNMPTALIAIRASYAPVHRGFALNT